MFGSFSCCDCTTAILLLNQVASSLRVSSLSLILKFARFVFVLTLDLKVEYKEKRVIKCVTGLAKYMTARRRRKKREKAKGPEPKKNDVRQTKTTTNY